MPVQLDTVIAEIEARVTAVYPSVLFRRGEREFATNDFPPRVVWVYGGETYDAPEKSRDNPRSLATAVATLYAHIWGVSRESAIAIRQNIHVAAYHVAYGSFEPVGTSFEELEQRHAEYGASCRFEMQFRMPVPDATVPEVMITGFLPAGDSVAGDGILQCGET
jgi:hypothetical protein